MQLIDTDRFNLTGSGITGGPLDIYFGKDIASSFSIIIFLLSVT